MKNVLCLAIFLSWSLAQGLAQVSINENGSPPDTSAMLEVISTNRGLLLPRHSLAGRNAIAAPAEGLIIYNTDCNDLQYFNGAGWVPLGNTGGLAAPGAITGPESVAGGAAGVAFSVAAMPGTTGYHWKVPPGATIASGQGSASITVTFGWCSGGEVSVRAYNDCNSSLSASVKQVKATLSVTHTAGAVAPVTKSVAYGLATGIPGSPNKCWITQNLGADRQASSATDATEASAGWYWQFNRKQGYKHDGTNRTPNSTWISDIIENSNWQSATDPCKLLLGTLWRLPTNIEWQNVDSYGNWETRIDGFSSELNLHAAGYLYDWDGSISSRGTNGKFHSSIQFDEEYSDNLSIYSSGSNQSYHYKSLGCSIRCLRDYCTDTPAAPAQGLHTVSDSGVVWRWGPVPGAVGYKWNITSDYYSALDMGASMHRTEPSLLCNRHYTRYVWAYNACGAYTAVPVLLTATTPACPLFVCGTPLAISHVAGDVAPVNKSVTYETVANVPGEPAKCWIARNLGASRQPFSVDDPSEEAAGWYWQFNRRQGYRYLLNREPSKPWRTLITEYSDWSLAQDPCNLELGQGWRIPTSVELYNIYYAGGWDNYYGPWNSALKMHCAGYIGVWLIDRGAEGEYWSSSHNFSSVSFGLRFTNSDCYLYSYGEKTSGRTVRCLRDSCSLLTSPTESIHSLGHSSIVWKWCRSLCASGYKWNTTDNFVTSTNMTIDTAMIETGLASSTTYTRYVWSYDAFQNPSAQSTTITATTTASCASFTKTHTAGSVAPVTKTVTYGVVTNIAGEPNKCWITRNLGASNQATAVSTNTEAAAGWYWQFNRKQGYKHDGTNRTPNTTWITSINENADWQSANDPCNLLLASPWRLPTYTEWYNVDNTGGWTNWNGPWGSGLKLHAAGYLGLSSGTLSNRGADGRYWSSTQYASYYGWNLYLYSYDSYMSSRGKAYGNCVRCLRD